MSDQSCGLQTCPESQAAAVLQHENDALRQENDRLRRQADGVAQANVRAAELMARLEENNECLTQEVQRRTRAEDAVRQANEQLGREVQERQRAEDRLCRHARIQAALNGLLSLSLENLTARQVLEQALQQITSLPWLALSKGAIFLVEDEPEVLVLAGQRGLAAPLLTACARVPFGKCLCGRAAQSGRLAFVEDLDDHHDITYDGLSPHGHYCTPILSGSKVLGVLNLYVEKGHARCDAEEDFLQAAATVLAGMIERQHAQQQQTQLVQKLSETNEELSHFAYVVSHDLKAPLRGIKLVTEWLGADYGDKLDAAAKEQMALLQSRVHRMHNLIEGVLQYSRIGRIKEAWTAVDLNELLPLILDTLAAPAHIHVTVQPDLPILTGEKTRITQVFQNLLSNAIKFSDKPQGEIHVGCVAEGDFWKFHVADNGPGIEARHFELIFRLFQTLAPKDEYESTGVGLTLVKKIVELSGGRVWVESEVGQGSTFYFTLPKGSGGIEEGRKDGTAE